MISSKSEAGKDSSCCVLHFTAKLLSILIAVTIHGKTETIGESADMKQLQCQDDIIHVMKT